MRSPFSFLRRLLGRPANSDVIQIFTPTVVSDRSAGTRLVLATASIFGLGIASAIALSAFVTLMLALGAIYFLVTQGLGIKLARCLRVTAQGID